MASTPTRPETVRVMNANKNNVRAANQYSLLDARPRKDHFVIRPLAASGNETGAAAYEPCWTGL